MNVVASELDALLEGDAAVPEHGVCSVCYPDRDPAGGIALCGYVFPAEEPVTDCAGLHKCAKCLATWLPPCGHL